MKKLPILHKKITSANNYQGKFVIGVIGTHKGAGVTHLCLLLANYISECLGKKTAFLEYFPQKEMPFLYCNYYVVKQDEDIPNPFTINHVTYYSNVKDQEVTEIIGDNYECVVLDFGTDFTKCKNEFLRCDKRIIVSSLALWKCNKLEEFINKTNHIKFNNLWNYVIPFTQEKDIKQAAKEFQREVLRAPYEPDPFVLSSETIKMFQKLI